MTQSDVNRWVATSSTRPVSPVLQFSLLIVPIVMNCFFMVYALVGWILDGRDKRNWSLEAESVAIWVGLAIVAYCAVVALYARWRGAARYHPLYVSSVGHVILVFLLIVSIFITVRL